MSKLTLEELQAMIARFPRIHPEPGPISTTHNPMAQFFGMKPIEPKSRIMMIYPLPEHKDEE